MMLAPIRDFLRRRVNQTLHGRSVYRSADVPGHNVFKGYGTWSGNGHKGVGDGLDLFAPAGTPVYAPFDGVQVRWDNDTSKLEVIYLQRADGAVAVLAHINATHEGEGVAVKAGEIVGTVRGDLGDPHLHYELWMGGKAVSARSARKLQQRLAQICGMR
jgi:murein DD-endopeptidase MepM/ murein hydrolase activator NlpD